MDVQTANKQSIISDVDDILDSELITDTNVRVSHILIGLKKR